MSHSTNKVPTGLTRESQSAVLITWSDGTETRWTARELRDACPCATCRERRKGNDQSEMNESSNLLPVLSAAEARPLTIETMRPVGNYAYSVALSDGRDCGIFTFDLLARVNEGVAPNDVKDQVMRIAGE